MRVDAPPCCDPCDGGREGVGEQRLDRRPGGDRRYDLVLRGAPVPHGGRRRLAQGLLCMGHPGWEILVRGGGVEAALRSSAGLGLAWLLLWG